MEPITGETIGSQSIGREKRWKTSKFLAILFFVLTLIIGTLLVQSNQDRKKLSDNLKTTRVQIEEAARQRREAVIQRKISEQQQQIAEQQRIMTEKERQFALDQQMIAQNERTEALHQKQLAEESRGDALNARDEAESQRKEAIQLKQIAEEQRKIAEKSEENARKLQLLAVAQSLAIQSETMQESFQGDLPDLLAVEAYLLNLENGGSVNDPDIFTALSLAADDIISFRSHKDEVRGIALSKDGRMLASCSMEGTVDLWDLNKETPAPIRLNVPENLNTGFRSICFSSDIQFLAAGDISGNTIVWNLEQPDKDARILSVSPAIITNIQFFSGNNKLVVANSAGKIRIWDLDQPLPSWKEFSDPQFSPVTAIICLNDNESVIWANENGKVYLYNPKSMSFSPPLILDCKNKITTLALNQEEDLLAVGYEDGMINLWNYNEIDQPATQLIGHISAVNDICFCPAREAMASCSYDGTIRIWDIKNMANQSVVLRDHDAWIYDIAITPDGDRLISAGADKIIRSRTINPAVLARDICSKITRNLTVDEWAEYIGQDIEYRNTCDQTER